MLNRTNQLRNLVQNTRNLAIENIQSAQEIQIQAQNKRFNVTETPLEIGTPVLVKNEGIIGKLEPRYRGKYYVDGQASGGNYKLIDSTGMKVKQTFPISKLKPFLEDNSEVHHEVEKILDKRKLFGDYQYLVKWKDFDQSHNEWLFETDFDDFKMINDYNNKFYPDQILEQISPIDKDKTKDAPFQLVNEKRRRGRAKKVIASPVFNIMTLLKIVIYLIQVSTIMATNKNKQSELEDVLKFENKTLITDDFVYCDKSLKRIVDLKSNCVEKSKKNEFKYREFDRDQAENDTFEVLILAKNKHTVYGFGYECKILVQKTILKSSFWSNHLPAIKTEEPLQISAEACWNLVNTQQCNEGINMKCQLTGCFSEDPDFSNSYFWWSEQVVSNKKCSFRRTEIIADSPIFGLFGRQDCMVEHGSCLFTDSIIVWDSNNITHNCPYEIVEKVVNLTSFNNDILYSKQKNLAFQIISEEKVCDPPIDIYKTTEGLYLTLTNHIFDHLTLTIQTHPQFKFTNQTKLISNLPSTLLASEMDRSKINIFENYKELNNRNCFALTNSIYLTSKSLNDEYFIIKDIYGNDLVLYTVSQHVYIPNCMRIKNISIAKNIPFDVACTKDIPVEVQFIRNKTITNELLYMNNDRIISRSSKKIKCDDEYMNMKIVLSNGSIVVRSYSNREKATKVEISDHPVIFNHISLVNFNITELNFKHQSQIIEEIDYNRYETNNLIMKGGRFYRPDVLQDEFETITDKFKGIVYYIHSKWFHFKIGFIVIGSIIALIIIIILIKIMWKTIHKIKSKKKKQIKSVNLIEGFLPTKNRAFKSNFASTKISYNNETLNDVGNKLIQKVDEQNFELLKLMKI